MRGGLGPSGGALTGGVLSHGTPVSGGSRQLRDRGIPSVVEDINGEISVSFSGPR